MTDQPTGTVTFLFTDIEGSTKMWDSYPMQMRNALTRHDEILRATIEANNGYVFKTVGDAFNATFRYPREALQAALATQRALRDEEWGEPIEELRVRMALHTGFAEMEHDGDYFGPALNQAARLLSTAHGGQIVLSDTVYNLVHDHPELVDEEARLIDSGEYRLKGLTHPMRVYQLVVPDLRRDFPPLRANRTPDDFDERYRFKYFLGEGGFAKVYLAHDERLKRDVAVKVLHPRYVDQEQFVRRFEREACSVAKLNHPNIVTIHDWGQKRDGTHYIVMEHLPGGALKDLVVKEGPLPTSTAIALTLQIAQALEDAHRRGIVHRDIKPQNVLLSERGDVKVADFGIARAVSASTVSLSSSLLLGTPHYMSPEQVKGEQASFRSDLYALGVVLYEMLTGKLPFDAETPIGILSKHLHEQVRSPKEINPNVPERLEAVTMRLLARDPGERYPDAAALTDELKQVLRSLEEDEDGRVVGRPASEGGVAREAGFTETFIDETRATPSTVEVPDLAGKNASQASSTLVGKGLKLGDQKEVTSETVPEGQITGQSPEAGTEVEPDSSVGVTVSSGPQETIVADVPQTPPTESVPDHRSQPDQVGPSDSSFLPRLLPDELLAGLFVLGLFTMLYALNLVDYRLAEVYEDLEIFVQNTESGNLILLKIAKLVVIAVLGFMLLILVLKPPYSLRVRFLDVVRLVVLAVLRLVLLALGLKSPSFRRVHVQPQGPSWRVKPARDEDEGKIKALNHLIMLFLALLLIGVPVVLLLVGLGVIPADEVNYVTSYQNGFEDLRRLSNTGLGIGSSIVIGAIGVLMSLVALVLFFRKMPLK